MSYKLINGDCLEVMPTLESGSVDAIICDLPYGTTSCHWDSVIPFEPLWAQYKRLIKPRGAIVLFGSQPFTSALIMSNTKWFKYCWVWKKDKATGHLNALIQPMADYEDIAVFGENGIRYYPQVEPKQKENIRPLPRRGATDSYGKYNEHADRLIPLDMSFPKRVLNFPTTNHGERGYHPTQKPVSLLRYLLRTYTAEGETILDNTMGSGSRSPFCWFFSMGGGAGAFASASLARATRAGHESGRERTTSLHRATACVRSPSCIAEYAAMVAQRD